MQSSVSIGLKVRTHKPGPDTNTHTHILLAESVLCQQTHTSTLTYSTRRHTVLQGKQAVKRVMTLSDSRKKRSDWLRQLRGGSFTTVRFRLCEIKTILKATTYPRIQAVHRTTHKAGLIFKPKPSLCSFNDELIRIRIFSTAIQTTDKWPICLFLSMVCQTVLQRLKSSYTIAESDLIFSLNSYFEYFSH